MALPPKATSLNSESLNGDTLQRSLNPFIKDTADAIDGQLTVLRNTISTKKTVQVTVPAVPWTSLQPYYGAGVSDALASTPGRYYVAPGGRIFIEGLLTVPATNPFTVLTLPEGLRSDVLFEMPQSAGGGTVCTISMGVVATGAISKNGASTTLSINMNYQLAASASAQLLPFSGPGWPIVVNPQLPGRVLRVSVLAVRDLNGNAGTATSMLLPAWSYADGNNIQINRLDGLIPGHQYEISFLFEGE